MKKGHLKKIIFVTVPTVVILTSYVLMSSHVSGSEDVVDHSNPVVKTITAERSNGEEQLQISGFIRGAERANIAPMTSGRILKIYKREGETIRQGESIAFIDADQVNAQANAANRSVEALKRTLNETDDYYDQIVDETKKTKDKEAIKSAKRARDLQKQIVESQIVVAEGSVGISQVGKNDAVVTAPFDGTITAMPVREGDFAAIGMSLASIDSPDNLELETYVTSDDGRKVSVGNSVQIQSAEGQLVSGTVIAVSPAVDTQNLKTLVRIHIDDTTKLVKLGDFVRGTIHITGVEEEPSIEIPRKAVISRGGDPIVFVIDENNVAQERAIELGSEQNENIRVIQGISAGEKVVVEGQHYLINNMTVTLYAAE